MVFLALGLCVPLLVKAEPVLKFANKAAIKYSKNLKVGEVEVLEFSSPVSLAQYGTSDESLKYIELEKLDPAATGYHKFMIKAKRPGFSELTFVSGKDLIKVEVSVDNDYEQLENELNKLFGIHDAKPEDRIKVVPANYVGDLSVMQNSFKMPGIYLSGSVASPKEAVLALAFAANALGDSGVKIFSNPGGQLRSKDLDSYAINSLSPSKQDQGANASFVEFYESTNKLIDTDNLYRDLILASDNEKVISFIRIKEPPRFAVKVRFLEMDSNYIDEFISSISLSGQGSDVSGAIGSNNLPIPSFGSNSGFGIPQTAIFSSQGIVGLSNRIVGANLVSGVAKLFDNGSLNLFINNLLAEGVLRVVNEFSLITHSGERISLGKGTRFPIPKINNNVGGSTVSVEYIPIGFKGELKVTALENRLIDVQLASRLTSAESGTSTIQGFLIPIFKEEFVNSGALLLSGQEVILNSFLTETETLAKASSPLGRIIPWFGKSKRKQRRKNLLFVALKAEEIEPASRHQAVNFNLPHLNLDKGRNIYADNQSDLRKEKITDTIDLRNYSQDNGRGLLDKVDPLELNGV
jgi:Flp pilus assembly secretin CpaC